MAPEFTRRTFLLGTAGLAALSACGGGDDPQIVVPDTSTTEGKNGSQLSLVLGSAGIVAGIEERVAFAVLEGSPPRPVKGGPQVTVSFAEATADGPGDPVEATYHSEGVEERPYWEIRRTFDKPGNYVMRATYDGRTADAGVPVLAPEAATSPYPGQPLPVVSSPTVADPKGIDPLCTRKPQCPLHDISIDEALGEKKPLILLFSTPALCQSAICGPVLDVLIGATPQFAGKANAIHVEVFTDLTGQTTTDAFKAFKLQIEPIFYFVGADGIIKERFDGPVDRPEMEQAIARLLT